LRHRTGAGSPQGAGANRTVALGHRSGRAQRSVCRASARLPRGAADRSRSPERQRRRDRAGTPARLFWRAVDYDARARDETPARSLRPRLTLRRRRHGRRDDYREPHMTTVTSHKGGEWLTSDVSADEIFTPERLTDEHRLVGQTAAEFVEKEVLPQVPQL